MPIFGLVVLAACGAPPQNTAPPTGEPDQVYTVRGRIQRLPPGDVQKDPRVLVAHEAIPDFVSAADEVVGMEAMSMSFPVIHTSLLEGLDEGDAIEFDLQVRWREDDPLTISRILPLGEGVVLGFENEAPGDEPQPDDEASPSEGPTDEG